MSAIHGHYVPKGYLKLFTTDGKYVGCYNKDSKMISNPNIANVCKIHGLYGTLDNNSNDIENGYFANSFEPYFYEMINRISEIKGYWLQKSWRVGIMEEDKASIALCLAIQYLRHPSIQNFVSDMTKQTFPKLINVMKSLVANIEADEKYKKLDISVKIDKALLHCSQTFGNEALLDTFVKDLSNNFYWEFLYDSGRSFVTSDCPVSIECFDETAKIQNLGLNMKSSRIIFPLTPELLLLLSEKAQFPASINFDKEFRIASDDEINHFNWVEYKNANRFIFGLNIESAIRNIQEVEYI